MKRLTFITLLALLISYMTKAQIDLPCSEEAMTERLKVHHPSFQEDIGESKERIRAFLSQENQAFLMQARMATYTIPTVLHILHDGAFGWIDAEQARSGIEVMNNDFNGLNDSWDLIEPPFDTIKGTLDIEFCLATLDPAGNPTDGIIYHDNAADYIDNQSAIQGIAWDNYKYLNIYLAKYVFDSTTNFTGYSYYPSLTNMDLKNDGIYYSSVRWGYGANSQLTPGQDWASVGTHEAGHWLNVAHTFQGGCNDQDFIDDTPPTLGGTIYLSSCYNNNMSCGEVTNGSNFMDYNHDCKRMFTKGQVDQMIAALHGPERNTIWADDNLIATGCNLIGTGVENSDSYLSIQPFPNPTQGIINFMELPAPMELSIYSVSGERVANKSLDGGPQSISIEELPSGIYFYILKSNNSFQSGKIAKL